LPIDGDSSAFLISLVVHLSLLVTLALIPAVARRERPTLHVSITPPEAKEVELALPEEFSFSSLPAAEVGANSFSGEAMALSLAPVISPVSDVPKHALIDTRVDVGRIEVNNAIELATGQHYADNIAVKGAAGEGITGAEGAIDRITHEILLSLEERKTLVVWLFDGTASLVPQRQAIGDRFSRIYQELGIVEASGNAAFIKHEDKPLLSSVHAFGSELHLMTKKPTDSLAELKQAVASIPKDDTGTENVFTAILDVARRFADLRYTTANRPEPERNVMIVVITDEAGSDQQRAEEAISLCRRMAMPVYVVGVPAPFGRRETLMKWVDPDPQYNQTPQWGVVEQGPESLLPERVNLSYAGSQDDEQVIDSGFGPYALTRLCYETGGIFFAVHPNRDVTRNVTRRETEAYSAYFTRFFDPEVMRKYRPDYVSVGEYERRARQNKARWSLIQAAGQKQLGQMESPTLRFVKTEEAAFAAALTTAQQKAASLEPKIDALFRLLSQGEADREKETVLRWQASFDLAIGRVLAVKVRTETYNAMLAAAKRGLKPKDPKNNTWVLEPSNEVSVGSQLAKQAEKAKEYLTRVVTEHPGTPWAHLAQRELADPLSWKWKEEFTDLSPPPRRAANPNVVVNPPPRPAPPPMPLMLPKAPPTRPPPKL
jgi:hypothetical protein